MIQRIVPGPNQESVWDYPRPPRCEVATKRVRIMLGDLVLADSAHAYRILETSHPPVYYLPPADIQMQYLQPALLQTFCEWKGVAHYYDLTLANRKVAQIAWYYPNPTVTFEAITGYVAFYPSRVDACYLEDERVQAQAGDFYGGWITSDIVGPFKGDLGSWGW